MHGPGIEPPTSGMTSRRANHYTTAPLPQLAEYSACYVSSVE